MEQNKGLKESTSNEIKFMTSIKPGVTDLRPLFTETADDDEPPVQVQVLMTTLSAEFLKCPREVKSLQRQMSQNRLLHCGKPRQTRAICCAGCNVASPQKIAQCTIADISCTEDKSVISRLGGAWGAVTNYSAPIGPTICCFNDVYNAVNEAAQIFCTYKSSDCGDVVPVYKVCLPRSSLKCLAARCAHTDIYNQILHKTDKNMSVRGNEICKSSDVNRIASENNLNTNTNDGHNCSEAKPKLHILDVSTKLEAGCANSFEPMKDENEDSKVSIASGVEQKYYLAEKCDVENTVAKIGTNLENVAHQVCITERCIEVAAKDENVHLEEKQQNVCAAVKCNNEAVSEVKIRLKEDEDYNAESSNLEDCNSETCSEDGLNVCNSELLNAELNIFIAELCSDAELIVSHDALCSKEVFNTESCNLEDGLSACYAKESNEEDNIVCNCELLKEELNAFTSASCSEAELIVSNDALFSVAVELNVFNIESSNSEYDLRNAERYSEEEESNVCTIASINAQNKYEECCKANDEDIIVDIDDKNKSFTIGEYIGPDDEGAFASMNNQHTGFIIEESFDIESNNSEHDLTLRNTERYSEEEESNVCAITSINEQNKYEECCEAYNEDIIIGIDDKNISFTIEEYIGANDEGASTDQNMHFIAEESIEAKPEATISYINDQNKCCNIYKPQRTIDAFVCKTCVNCKHWPRCIFQAVDYIKILLNIKPASSYAPNCSCLLIMWINHLRRFMITANMQGYIRAAVEAKINILEYALSPRSLKLMATNTSLQNLYTTLQMMLHSKTNSNMHNLVTRYSPYLITKVLSCLLAANNIEYGRASNALALMNRSVYNIADTYNFCKCISFDPLRKCCNLEHPQNSPSFTHYTLGNETPIVEPNKLQMLVTKILSHLQDILNNSSFEHSNVESNESPYCKVDFNILPYLQNCSENVSHEYVNFKSEDSQDLLEESRAFSYITDIIDNLQTKCYDAEPIHPKANIKILQYLQDFYDNHECVNFEAKYSRKSDFELNESDLLSPAFDLILADGLNFETSQPLDCKLNTKILQYLQDFFDYTSHESENSEPADLQESDFELNNSQILAYLTDVLINSPSRCLNFETNPHANMNILQYLQDFFDYVSHESVNFEQEHLQELNFELRYSQISDSGLRDSQESDFTTEHPQESDIKSKDSEVTGFELRKSQKSGFELKDSQELNQKSIHPHESDFGLKHSQELNLKSEQRSHESNFGLKHSQELNSKSKPSHESGFALKDSQELNQKSIHPHEPDFGLKHSQELNSKLKRSHDSYFGLKHSKELNSKSEQRSHESDFGLKPQELTSKSKPSHESGFALKDSQESEFRRKCIGYESIDSQESDIKSKQSQLSSITLNCSQDLDYESKDSQESDLKTKDSQESGFNSKCSQKLDYVSKDCQESDINSEKSPLSVFKLKCSQELDYDYDEHCVRILEEIDLFMNKAIKNIIVAMTGTPHLDCNAVDVKDTRPVDCNVIDILDTTNVDSNVHMINNSPVDCNPKLLGFKSKSSQVFNYESKGSDFKSQETQESDFVSKYCQESGFKSKCSQKLDYISRDLKSLESQESDFVSKYYQKSGYKSKCSQTKYSLEPGLKSKCSQQLDYKSIGSDFKSQESQESDFKMKYSQEPGFKSKSSQEFNYESKGSDFKSQESDFKSKYSQNSDFEMHETRNLSHLLYSRNVMPVNCLSFKTNRLKVNANASVCKVNHKILSYLQDSPVRFYKGVNYGQKYFENTHFKPRKSEKLPNSFNCVYKCLCLETKKPLSPDCELNLNGMPFHEESQDSNCGKIVSCESQVLHFDSHEDPIVEKNVIGEAENASMYDEKWLGILEALALFVTKTVANIGVATGSTPRLDCNVVTMKDTLHVDSNLKPISPEDKLINVSPRRSHCRKFSRTYNWGYEQKWVRILERIALFVNESIKNIEVASKNTSYLDCNTVDLEGTLHVDCNVVDMTDTTNVVDMEGTYNVVGMMDTTNVDSNVVDVIGNVVGMMDTTNVDSNVIDVIGNVVGMTDTTNVVDMKDTCNAVGMMDTTNDDSNVVDVINISPVDCNQKSNNPEDFRTITDLYFDLHPNTPEESSTTELDTLNSSTQDRCENVEVLSADLTHTPDVVDVTDTYSVDCTAKSNSLEDVGGISSLYFDVHRKNPEEFDAMKLLTLLYANPKTFKIPMQSAEVVTINEAINVKAREETTENLAVVAENYAINECREITKNREDAMGSTSKAINIDNTYRAKFREITKIREDSIRNTKEVSARNIDNDNACRAKLKSQEGSLQTVGVEANDHAKTQQNLEVIAEQDKNLCTQDVKVITAKDLNFYRINLKSQGQATQLLGVIAENDVDSETQENVAINSAPYDTKSKNGKDATQNTGLIMENNANYRVFSKFCTDARKVMPSDGLHPKTREVAIKSTAINLIEYEENLVNMLESSIMLFDSSLKDLQVALMSNPVLEQVTHKVAEICAPHFEGKLEPGKVAATDTQLYSTGKAEEVKSVTNRQETHISLSNTNTCCHATRIPTQNARASTVCKLPFNSANCRGSLANLPLLKVNAWKWPEALRMFKLPSVCNSSEMELLRCKPEQRNEKHSRSVRKAEIALRNIALLLEEVAAWKKNHLRETITRKESASVGGSSLPLDNWLLGGTLGSRNAILVFKSSALACPSEQSIHGKPGHKLHITYRVIQAETKLLAKLLECHGINEAPANTGDYNLLWTGSHPKPGVLRSMSPHQRVNHFPRSYELTRKDRLYKNIEKMQHAKGLKHFDFIPQTFLMPTEYKDLCTTHHRVKGPWIVKPAASSRGRGIYIVESPNQVPLEEPVVVAKYLSKPLLIKGHKCDLRLYVAVTSFDPLLVYIYEEGMVRFATVKYDTTHKQLWNPCMHLCNYSINKYHSDYVKSDDPSAENVGHKWTLSALLRHLKSIGKDTAHLMSQVEDLVVKAILACGNSIITACKMFVPNTNNCFELYGFDILIDENLKPWLLEVNLSPSLGCDSPLDVRLKSAMLSDLLTLVGIPAVDPMLRPSSPTISSKNLKIKLSNCRRVHSADGLSNTLPRKSGTNTAISSMTLSNEELKMVKNTKSQFERRGGFVRIFPAVDSWAKYSQYLEPVTGIPIAGSNCSLPFTMMTQHNNNQILYTQLFPDVPVATPILRNEKLYVRHTLDRKRDSSLDSVRKLDTSASTPRQNRYERKLIQGYRSSLTMPKKQLQESNSDELKRQVCEMLKNGSRMSQVEARRAFSQYLMCVLKRISCSPEQEGHVEIVLKFLQKASTYLKNQFNVKIPSHKLSDKDRAAVVAKQLNDFLYLYNRETDLYTDLDRPGQMPKQMFCEFLEQARESDLEEVLILQNIHTVPNKGSQSTSSFQGLLRCLPNLTGSTCFRAPDTNKKAVKVTPLS